jgi:hypothetical protein
MASPMFENDLSAYRRRAYIEFSQKYAIPKNWELAINCSFETASPTNSPIEFEFDNDSYLEDERYVHILTLDECCQDTPEGGETFYVFAVWLVKDLPLSECPVVASVWKHNGDESCSPDYTQEVTANNMNEFLRQLATGVAGRDQSTSRANLIDVSPFAGLAQPFDSVGAASDSIEAASSRFDDIPRPKGWHDE